MNISQKLIERCTNSNAVKIKLEKVYSDNSLCCCGYIDYSPKISVAKSDDCINIFFFFFCDLIVTEALGHLLNELLCLA